MPYLSYFVIQKEPSYKDMKKNYIIRFYFHLCILNNTYLTNIVRKATYHYIFQVIPLPRFSFFLKYCQFLFI